MTIKDYNEKNLPESYYPTMHMDGYFPEEILMTARKQFTRDAEANQEEDSIGNVHITSEVSIKK